MNIFWITSGLLWTEFARQLLTFVKRLTKTLPTIRIPVNTLPVSFVCLFVCLFVVACFWVKAKSYGAYDLERPWRTLGVWNCVKRLYIKDLLSVAFLNSGSLILFLCLSMVTACAHRSTAYAMII